MRSPRGPEATALGPGDEPSPLLAVAVLGLVAATRFLALAASPSEIDEAIFAGAVLRFDVFDLSPQAPGFPVWVLLGRLARLVVPDAFLALATVSTISSALAFPALWVWGRTLVGGRAALAACLFAASLPVVWLNGGRAFSDTPGTALLLLALALLAESARAPRLLGAAAGLAAAAGLGVRPHLGLAFGAVLLLEAWRARRRDASSSMPFALAAIAGVGAWGAWLVAQTGGPAGLLASMGERAAFRAQALATGSVGAFAESFLVRDLLSPRRAAVFWAISLVGLLALFARRRRDLAVLLLVLAPAFVSLYFLHNRSMVRYSVPFALVAALLFGAGLRVLLVRPAPALLAAALGAGLFARETLPEVLASAREDAPPFAAVSAIARFAHPGRETIVADGVFHAFLRLERWEGRLAAWAVMDSDLVRTSAPTNRRVLRLADLTGAAAPPDRRDPAWRSWYRGGRILESLSTGRLLAVGVRDPGPPVFRTGFGVRERLAGGRDARWAGNGARLSVPPSDPALPPLVPLMEGRMRATGLECPPVALLDVTRPEDGTRVVVRRASDGAIAVERNLPAGRTLLAIPPLAPAGDAREEYLVECDRPVALPAPAPGSVRPRDACFLVEEWARTTKAEAIWPRVGSRAVLPLEGDSFEAALATGFQDAEPLPDRGLVQRWTTGSSGFAWFPWRGAAAPRRLVLRARAPGSAPVEVRVEVNGVGAGVVRVEPGDFADRSLDLGAGARRALAGPGPVRVTLRSPVFNPRALGIGDDERDLGVAVVGIAFEN